MIRARTQGARARRALARRLAPAAALALAACGTGAAHAPPHVLLVSVDTLRPDYLSSEGYDRPTTPRLDALLAPGCRFEQALSPEARTTPALASLLTGAYPHRTGVRSLTDPLPQDVPTLAEVLRDQGYQTLAVVTQWLLGPRRGFARGFEVYDQENGFRRANATTDAALAQLGELDPRRPVFAWVHYLDPHVPYHPAAETARAFDPGYRGPYATRFGYQPGPGERHDAILAYPIDLPKRVVTHHDPLPERVNAHIRRLYAADVHGIDAPIARLVEAFRARLGDVLLVFTADHGESLGEHGYAFDHGDDVYAPGTRVPLVVVAPEGYRLRCPRRCDDPVSLVDVVPTLAELLGVRLPAPMAARVEGRSLAPWLRGEPLTPAPVFAESGRQNFPASGDAADADDVAQRARAVVMGHWKLVWKPTAPEDQALELYDLAADPGETRDLARPDHPALAPLRGALDAWLAREPGAAARAAGALAPDDLRALRALGYAE